MVDEQNLDNQTPDESETAQAEVTEDLAGRVHSLEEQLAAAQDQSLRVAAELQNVRRRAEHAHRAALGVEPLAEAVDAAHDVGARAQGDPEQVNSDLGHPPTEPPSPPSR